MSGTPTRGVTIRLFLVDGTPHGLRLVERASWTGVMLAFSRADYAAARQRVEFARTGAYVLVGPDPDGPRGHRVYVGESDVVGGRLDRHQREKDFWTHGYVLTTKDDSLNKAHVRYLEARLLQLAAAADNASVENGTTPPVLRLSEPEVAEMETYLDNVLPLFGVVGVDVFTPADEDGVETHGDETADRAAAPSAPRLYLRRPLTDAEGEDRASGFLVFEGSLGRRQPTPSLMEAYRQMRDRLVHEGVLVEAGEQLRLTKSYLFDSPSAAASVLCGAQKNGRTEWKDAAGVTLRELQARSAT